MSGPFILERWVRAVAAKIVCQRASSIKATLRRRVNRLGNATLDVQKSNNFEWGIDYLLSDTFIISSSFFLRNQFDTIDWVRDVASNPWQAENVGDIDACGSDFQSLEIL